MLGSPGMYSGYVINVQVKNPTIMEPAELRLRLAGIVSALLVNATTYCISTIHCGWRMRQRIVFRIVKTMNYLLQSLLLVVHRVYVEQEKNEDARN